MGTEKDYVVVMCPHCGKKLDIPYQYDGTYQILHSSSDFYLVDSNYVSNNHGCGKSFYVGIVDGRLHIHGTEEALATFLDKLKGR